MSAGRVCRKAALDGLLCTCDPQGPWLHSASENPTELFCHPGTPLQRQGNAVLLALALHLDRLCIRSCAALGVWCLLCCTCKNCAVAVEGDTACNALGQHLFHYVWQLHALERICMNTGAPVSRHLHRLILVDFEDAAVRQTPRSYPAEAGS